MLRQAHHSAPRSLPPSRSFQRRHRDPRCRQLRVRSCIAAGQQRSEIQRSRGSEIQRPRGPEVQRSRGSEIQRFRDLEAHFHVEKLHSWCRKVINGPGFISFPSSMLTGIWLLCSWSCLHLESPVSETSPQCPGQGGQGTGGPHLCGQCCMSGSSQVC